MKLVILLALAVGCLRPTCVEADGHGGNDTDTDTNSTMPETNATEEMFGSGSGVFSTETTTMADDVTSNVTTSTQSGGQSGGLGTDELVGIIVGVVAFAVLLAALTTIVIIMCIKSTLKAQKISPQKVDSSPPKPDVNVTTHAKSEVKEKLPMVDT